MKRVVISIFALIISLPLYAQKDFDRLSVPKPIFEETPDFVDLYYKAGEITWDHIKHQDGIYQTPYIDEAL